MAIFILPDTPRPSTFVRTLGAIVGPVLRQHPSGNPWIMGSPGRRQQIYAANRNVEVLVIGHSNITEGNLSVSLSQARRVRDLDALAESLAEFDTLILARDCDSIRAQAPAFHTRSFFWTNTATGSILSDEQLPLARLNGLTLEPGVFVSRLSDAELSAPFATHTVWQGVESLGAGEYLTVRGRAAPERRLWWVPPSPTYRLAELGPVVAAGIREAISARTVGAKVISTDLSGGLDSTTLSFYAAECAATHHTFFMSSTRIGNHDREWASRAAEELGSMHLVAPYQDAMATLGNHGIVTLERFPEGPSMMSASAAAAPWIAQKLRGTGSTLHLNGHGGDALFGPVSTMLWSLVHSRTPDRLRRALRHCALNRIPLRAALKMLTHRGSLSSDLARLSQHDFDQPKHPQEEYSRWVVTPHVHPAITASTREEFTRLISREARRSIREFSPDRTVHQIVQFLSVHGSDVRRMNQAMGPDASLYFDSPLLDLRIVKPALALNIAERAYQYPAKPLLAAARPPTMSIDYFLRRDKGEYSAEAFDDHRAQRERVRSLFADGSELETSGIICRTDLLRSLDAYSQDGQQYMDVSYLELGERWLRSLSDARSEIQSLTSTSC